MTNDFVKCHFTLEELEYFESIIDREELLRRFVAKQIAGLESFGVEIKVPEPPNIFGKLGSYIKKAKAQKSEKV